MRNIGVVYMPRYRSSTLTHTAPDVRKRIRPYRRIKKYTRKLPFMSLLRLTREQLVMLAFMLGRALLK